jgi:hypothetical protein
MHLIPKALESITHYPEGISSPHNSIPNPQKAMSIKLMMDSRDEALDKQDTWITLPHRSQYFSADQSVHRKGPGSEDKKLLKIMKSADGLERRDGIVTSSLKLKRNSSFDSTAGKKLKNDYALSLNDFDGLNTNRFKENSDKQRKERNRNPSRKSKRYPPSIFDFDRDSDLSDITLDNVDWIANFEKLDIDHLNEKLKNEQAFNGEDVNLVSFMKNNVLFPQSIVDDGKARTEKGCKSIIPKQKCDKILGRVKLRSFQRGSKHRDSLVDTLTKSSEWQSHKSLLDDWRTFIEEIHPQKRI